MLQTQTVKPGAFSLLEELHTLPKFQEFALVGGTALSLMFGHRLSVDLDFFSPEPFTNEEISKHLADKFGTNFQSEKKPPQFGVFCYINGIKVDIVRHPHVMLKPILEIEGLRFFSKEDIVAMKVQAILGRAKKKDFWDIAELLQHYPVQDFIDFHSQKYPNQYLLISIPQAMIYFSEADEDEDPISLKGQTWDSVKNVISKNVRKFLA